MKSNISLHNMMRRRVFLAVMVFAILPLAASAQYSVEYFWDTDPGIGRGTTLMTSSENSFTQSAAVSVDGVSIGVHKLGLRALNKTDAATYYSETQYRNVLVAAPAKSLRCIEYFWDEDPGVGKGYHLDANLTDADHADLSYILDTSGLTKGVHRLGLRALTNGTWSETQTRLFVIRDYYDDDVVRVEYYWDTDPGLGNGIALSETPAGEINISKALDVSELSVGKHIMYLRAKSGTGNWGEATQGYEVEILGDIYIITDDDPIIPADTYEPHTIKYKRTSSSVLGGYMSFCLPFDVDLSNTDCFDKVYESLDMSFFNTDTGMLSIFLKNISMTSTIPTGVKFLAHLNGKEISLYNSNTVTMAAGYDNPTPTAMSVYDFQGQISGALFNDEDIDLQHGGTYKETAPYETMYTFKRDGNLDVQTDNLEAFRAFFIKSEKNGAKVLGIVPIFSDDTSTGIEDIMLSTATRQAKPTTVYSVDGRVVGQGDANTVLKHLQKGVYIINGKKVKK